MLHPSVSGNLLPVQVWVVQVPLEKNKRVTQWELGRFSHLNKKALVHVETQQFMNFQLRDLLISSRPIDVHIHQNVRRVSRALIVLYNS